MKLKFKFGVFAGLLFCTLTTMDCRSKPQPPLTDIGFSCQRLSSCYLNYGNMLNDLAVKKLVEDAQISKDETKCLNAIDQFSAAVKQDCPF